MTSWLRHPVNEFGQLLNVTLTPGNIDDRQPVPDLVSGGSVTESVTRGKVMNKVPNFIEELELYPL